MLIAPIFLAAVGYVAATGRVQLLIGGGFSGGRTPQWVATTIAVVGTLLTALVGFYVVRGGIERDQTTGVGTLMATTPTKTSTYLLGKWLGYTATLVLLTGALAGVALITVLLNGIGNPSYNTVIDVLSPFALLVLPVASLTAGVAVCFDAIRQFRGTIGSVGYFVGLLVVLALVGTSPTATIIDPFGFTHVEASTVSAISTQYPEAESRSFVLTVVSQEPRIFSWPGLEWTVPVFSQRLLIAFSGALASVLAVPLFDRFDSQRSWTARRRARGQSHNTHRAARIGTAESPTVSAPTIGADLELSRLSERRTVSFARLVRAEVRLTFRGQPWWWYLALVATSIGGWVGGISMLTIAWIVPLAAWSELGTRAARHGVDVLIASSTAGQRSVVATWLSGVLLATIAAAGAIALLVTTGQLGMLVAVFVGCLFVPTLAISLGFWTRTQRAFEMIFLLLWYFGPVNGTAPLDFTGRSGGLATVATFAAITVLLAISVMIGRSRRSR